MSLSAPTEDFTEILDQIGQSVTIRVITRTIDSDGNVTATSTADTSTTAVVQEVSYKEKIYLQMGICQIGDTMFFISPSTILSIYDQVLWNATTFKIRKILVPPRIGSQILYKQVFCVMDSGAFPT
jgi:hypothetical protein